MLKVETPIIDLDYDPISRKYRVGNDNPKHNPKPFKEESKLYSTNIKMKSNQIKQNKSNSYKNLLEKKGTVIDFTIT